MGVSIILSRVNIFVLNVSWWCTFHSSDFVSISNTTGQLQTTALLDYEVQPFYQVIVSVTEVADAMGEPITHPYASTTTVLVVVNDMNDNTPVFAETQYVGRVEEGASPHVVLTVSIIHWGLNKMAAIL